MENSIQVNNIDTLVMRHTNPGSVVVDLGAGSGALARSLLDAGYKDVHLVDVQNYLELSGMSGYSFYKVDLNFKQLPLKDNFADFVVLNSVIEHLENPYLVVRESARILKSGGKLLITMPNIHSLRSKVRFVFLGNLFGYTDTNNHLSLFTNATFKKAFSSFFKVIDIRYSDGFIKIPYKQGRNGWFHKKIIFPSKYTRGLFSSDVIYVLERL